MNMWTILNATAKRGRDHYFKYSCFYLTAKILKKQPKHFVSLLLIPETALSTFFLRIRTQKIMYRHSIILLFLHNSIRLQIIDYQRKISRESGSALTAWQAAEWARKIYSRSLSKWINDPAWINNGNISPMITKHSLTSNENISTWSLRLIYYQFRSAEVKAHCKIYSTRVRLFIAPNPTHCICSDEIHGFYAPCV